MSRFVTNRDMNFITGINKELVDDIIETKVILYSLDVHENEKNIYQEALEKVYKVGIEVPALITHDDSTTQDDQSGPEILQNIIVAFRRIEMKALDFYPERGDVTLYNNAYYEISNVVDNQYIAGRVGLPHSIICTAVMVNRSSINIREEIQSPLNDQNPSTNQQGY